MAGEVQKPMGPWQGRLRAGNASAVRGPQGTPLFSLIIEAVGALRFGARYGAMRCASNCFLW